MMKENVPFSLKGQSRVLSELQKMYSSAWDTPLRAHRSVVPGMMPRCRAKLSRDCLFAS